MVSQFSSTDIYGLPPVCQPVDAEDSEITKIQHLPFGSSQYSKIETQTHPLPFKVWITGD